MFTRATRCVTRPFARSFSLAAPPASAQPTNLVNKQARERPQTWGSAGKAASSLFDAAQAAKNLPQVNKDLKTFTQAYTSDENLMMKLESPMLYGEQFKPVVEEVCKNLKITSKQAKSLIEELVVSRKLKRLPKIVEDFDRLTRWESNEVVATITSAAPLSAEQSKKLQAALKSHLNKDEKLVLVQKVNPDLIGGLTVEMGERAIDLSVSSRLAEVNRAVRA